MITKKVLTLADLKGMAEACEAHAKANGWNVSFAIVDDGAHLLYLVRMDGASPATAQTCIRKARSAALYRRETKTQEENIKAGRVSMLNMPDIMPLEGGVPIVIDNQVIGAVGVSGVQSAQDAEIARAGIATLG